MRPGTAILALAAALSAAGCSGKPATVMESDVPVPPGMDALSTSDVDQAGGTLHRARIVCKGDLRSVRQATEGLQGAFSAQGWTCTAIDARKETATAIFAKDARIATGDVHVKRIDPKMSGAVIRVRSSDEPASAAPDSARDSSEGQKAG